MNYSLGGAAQDKREPGPTPRRDVVEAVRGRVIDMKLIDMSKRRIDRDISQSCFCNIWPGVASWKERSVPSPA
jgi:hypothetical protein